MGERRSTEGAQDSRSDEWDELHWSSTDAHASALAESEERFRLAMDLSAVAMNICGPDGRFQRVNEAMCRLFDRTASDLLACTWQELTHPDDLSADEALADEVLAGSRDHYRIVKRYLRPDRSVVWGDLTVTCVRDDDRSVAYFIGQIIDVTEYTAAREELQRNAALLSQLIDHAPLGTALMAADGTFLRVNPALADFLDRPQSALMGLSWQDISPAEPASDERELVAQIVAGERDTYRILKEFPREGGGPRAGLLTVTCVRDGDGQPLHMIGQIVDVTRERDAHALLEVTLDSLLDRHILAAPVITESGGIIDVVVARANAAFCDSLSMRSDEVVGVRLGELPLGEGAAELLSCCRIAWQEQALSIDDFPLASSIEGQTRWFDIRVVRVGELLSLTWREVSERHHSAAELIASEALYRLIADNATDVVISTSVARGIDWVSPSVTEVLGWLPQDLLGRHVRDLMHPDDLASAIVRQREIIDSGVDEGRVTARFATKGGGWRWMSDHGRLVRDAEGRPLAGIDSLRDVHMERDALDTLQRREQELRGVIDTLIDPWVLLVAIRGGAGEIVDFVFADANEAACEYNRMPREELLGSSLLTVLPAHGPSGIFDKYALVVDTGIPLADDEAPFVDVHDGVERRFDNRAVKVGDGISLTWRDVTERYEARQRLRDDAERDLLTGVANRRQLDRSLAELASRTPRIGTQTAILYCDLDRFKEANDSLGHAAGDRILLAVANGIRRAIRQDDLVARPGGDEFVVVLNGIRGVDEARVVATKVARSVAAPVTVAGTRIEPRLSIGVAVLGPDEDPRSALLRADSAMYRAKRAGRDRVFIDEDAIG